MEKTRFHCISITLTSIEMTKATRSQERVASAVSYWGLAMAVKPSRPVITVLLYPLAQWMMSRRPSSSLPPTIPTWTSSG